MADYPSNVDVNVTTNQGLADTVNAIIAAGKEREDAAGVGYDNSTTGGTATNVQDRLDISTVTPTVGNAGKLVAVNGAGDGMETVDVPSTGGVAIAPQSIVKAPLGSLPPGWSAGECDPPAQTLLADKILPHTTYWSPYGTVSASSEFEAARAAWQAFDGLNVSEANSWTSAAGDNVGAWLRYTLGLPRSVNAFSITARNNTGYNYPSAFRLQGSNDNGANWTDLHTETGIVFTQAEKKTFTLASPSALYKDYRLYIDAYTQVGTTSTWVGIGEFEFSFDDVPAGSVVVPADVQTAYVWDSRVELSQELASGLVVDLSSAADGIHHVFADYNADGSWQGLGHTDVPLEIGTSRAGVDAMPAFSSATLAGWGTVSASGNTTNFDPWRVFDKQPAADANMWTLPATNAWLRLVLTETRTIVGYSIRSRNNASVGQAEAPKDWTFRYGTDDTPNTTADTQVDQTNWGQAVTNYYMLPSAITAKSIELNITDNNGDTEISIDEIVLFFTDDFLNTAEWKHYDKDGNAIRRVYHGWVRKDGGEIVEVASTPIGTKVKQRASDTGGNGVTYKVPNLWGVQGCEAKAKAQDTNATFQDMVGLFSGADYGVLAVAKQRDMLIVHLGSAAGIQYVSGTTGQRTGVTSTKIRIDSERGY